MKTKRRRRKNNSQKIKLIGLVVFLLLIAFLMFLFRNKEEEVIVEDDGIDKISLVRGIDVSRYQGEIDFDVLYDQSIRFAFIKATEGIEYIDPNYFINFQNSKESGMKTGAYHFYRFESTGRAQAEYFIQNVELSDEDLPPVIDLEYYGRWINNPQSPNELIPELRDMVDLLREHYNKKPIIYCNRYVYEHYLKNDFSDVDYWYREIGRGYPSMPDNTQWMFWQYDDMAKLEGYGGPGANEYIDLNYFYGDLDDLEEYGRNNN